MQIEKAREFVHGLAIADQLRVRAAAMPQQIYGVEGQRVTTLGDLDELVDAVVRKLKQQGISARSRVAVALPTTVQHATIILALFRLGALWVPMNAQLKGLPLAHQITDAQVTHLLVHDGSELAADAAEAAVDAVARPFSDGVLMLDLQRTSLAAPLSDTALLMYTSGTTGPPKGVLVSASMLRASVLGTLHVTNVQAGDVMYLWEPLFHIGGAQTMLIPLYTEAMLAFAPRFSASRFWADVTRHGVTHVHYLGGVLQILLQLPESEEEKRNQVRVAWGAGATAALWEASKERFGFALHECYGLTETSSIVTVNENVADGGVGIPVPWFDVAVRPLIGSNPPYSRDGIGGIAVRGRFAGLVTAGYLDDPEATAKTRDEGWFRTGDLGRWDTRGHLHFEGRASDSVRVRGENVSAWQIEEVFGQHPHVDRCAVVGVEADVGEQEMMLFLTPAEGSQLDPQQVLAWGAKRLARFQVPRFAKIIGSMPLTPSQRVAKHRLPREVSDAVEMAAFPR
jgi:crotonobetaine/carnitine-CoA ligase